MIICPGLVVGNQQVLLLDTNLEVAERYSKSRGLLDSCHGDNIKQLLLIIGFSIIRFISSIVKGLLESNRSGKCCFWVLELTKNVDAKEECMIVASSRNHAFIQV